MRHLPTAPTALWITFLSSLCFGVSEKDTGGLILGMGASIGPAEVLIFLPYGTVSDLSFSIMEEHFYNFSGVT